MFAASTVLYLKEMFATSTVLYLKEMFDTSTVLYLKVITQGVSLGHCYNAICQV